MPKKRGKTVASHRSTKDRLVSMSREKGHSIVQKERTHFTSPKKKTVASHGPTNTLFEAAKVGGRAGARAGASSKKKSPIRSKSAPAKSWRRKPV